MLYSLFGTNCAQLLGQVETFQKEESPTGIEGKLTNLQDFMNAMCRKRDSEATGEGKLLSGLL